MNTGCVPPPYKVRTRDEDTHTIHMTKMLADALTMSQLFLDFKLDNDLILHINKEKGKYAGSICT